MNLSISQTTFIRAIAIIMIVLFHLVPFIPELRHDIVRTILFQGVGLFVISAGYGLYHSVQRTSRRTFLIKRLLTIYPAYIITVVALIVLGLGFGLRLSPLGDNVSLSVILHLSLLHVFFEDYFYAISPVLWYVGLAAQYMLFVTLMKDKLLRYRHLVAAVGVSLAYVMIVSLDTFDEWNRVLRLGLLLIWIVPFCIGYFLAQGKQPRYFPPILFLVSLAASLAAILCDKAIGPRFGLSADYTWAQTAIEIATLALPSIPLWLGLAWIAKKSTLIVRLLKPIGDLSYGIYLVHISILPIVFDLHLSLTNKLLVYIASTLVISLLLTALSNVITSRLAAVIHKKELT